MHMVNIIYFLIDGNMYFVNMYFKILYMVVIQLRVVLLILATVLQPSQDHQLVGRYGPAGIPRSTSLKDAQFLPQLHSK